MNNEKNISALELIKTKYAGEFTEPDATTLFDVNELETLMIEFAQYHVKRALESASINADTTHLGGGFTVVDPETILESYNLNQII